MNTLSENYKYISLIHPKSITATETGSTIDIEGYEDDAIAVFDYGALGGTTETFDGKIQVSSDGGSNWTDALTIGQVTGTNGDNKVAAGRVSLAGKNKVRAVVTMSGTSASLVQVGLLARANVGTSTVNSSTPA